MDSPPTIPINPSPLLPHEVKPTMEFPHGKMSSNLLAELNDRGCLSTKGTLSPTELTNPIYPLFSARSFPDLKKKEHTWLEPALKLASHFVTEESLAKFWTRLHHGEIGLQWRSGEEVRYIFDVPNQNAQDKARMKKETQGALGKIARGLKIVIMPAGHVVEETEMFGKPFTEENSSNTVGLRIGLDPDVIRYIQVQASKKEFSPEEACQNLRFHFLLAHGLVRSTVRLFYLHTHETSTLGEEPYWDLAEQELEIEPDLGVSWEMFMFGCKVLKWHAPPSTRKDSASVLEPPPKIENALSVFLHTPRTAETGIDTMYEHTTVLPMSWVQAWFKQSTWNDIHDKGPVDGRPAIGHAPILVSKDEPASESPGGQANVEWRLEKFDHEQLKAHGGFNTTDEKEQEWIYGSV